MCHELHFNSNGHVEIFILIHEELKNVQLGKKTFQNLHNLVLLEL